MNSGFQKNRLLFVTLFLSLLLVTFNHCVTQTSNSGDLGDVESGPGPAPTDFPPTPGAPNPVSPSVDQTQISITAFANTLHPITRQRCVLCHGSFQQPLHAIDDPTMAHNAVIDTFKVNFNNIPSSRMSAKLRDEGHNCWSDCTQNANEIANAITAWRDQVIAAGGEPISTDEYSNGLRTSNSLPLVQELDPDNARDNGTSVIDMASASLVSPMITAQENNISYIWVPNGNGGLLQNNANNAGIGSVTFNTSQSDVYKIYALVDAPNNGDNSFHVRVDNGPYYEWHITETNGFEWREVTDTNQQNEVSLFIAAGDGHVFQARQREDGTRIATVVVSNDPNINLNDISGSVVATLTYDLSALLPGAQATLEVDVQDYDEYSYRFTNPRILSNQNILVRDMKLLINGQYNPQHATYTLVNKLTTPNDNVLSDRSLVALKDQGPNIDVISFTFEILQVQ